MYIPELESIAKARRQVEEIASARYLDQQAVPYFAPTDFAELCPTRQEAETRIKLENEHGNRVRVSLHMCLAAAAGALQVCEALLKTSSQLSAADRTRGLLACSVDARTSAVSALRASLVLAGQQKPTSESLMEIRRG